MSEALTTHRRFAASAGESILYPLGVEQGAIYSILAANGTRAVLNDPSDRDFIGYLTEPPSGLDGAGIRESADTLPEGDGGIHGAFWTDRLSFTLTGLLYPDNTAASLRQEKLRRACRALRTDSQLLWTPAVSQIPVRVSFRTPQPPRITGRYPKQFLVTGVSANPFIESQDLQTAQTASTVTVTNNGGIDAWPLLTLYGPLTNPTVANTTNGGSLAFTITLATSSDYLVIDTNPRRRTITLGNTTNRYSALNFATSTWWPIAPGDNTITLTATGTGTLVVQWRHTWG